MKLWIPTIGDRIRLLEDWTFPVTRESRNGDLISIVDPDGGHYHWAHPTHSKVAGAFTIPAQTVLKIDRVYIRGSSGDAREFDSVTFRVHECPARRDLTSRKFGGTGSVAVRFFAKLSDVNLIEAEPVDAQRP